MTTDTRGRPEAGAMDAVFGCAAEVTASAPGRVNLIGEHTDYNGGYVLPMAIPQRTRVDLSRRSDRSVRVASDAPTAGRVPLVFELGRERRRGSWLDYVQGVAVALRRAGHAIRGFDALVRSNVPIGTGLSSSAALEVGLLRALREAFSLTLDDVALARLARAAETDFVGAPVGIMDPMAASLADTTTAMFLDTRSLAFERLPLPADCEVLVIDSGVTHGHAQGDYKVRRDECERAAALLGLPQLRDATALTSLSTLPEPLFRRARHVVTEDARVLSATRMLRDGNAPALGALLDASHASLRDDFDVSTPDVDRLVTLARREPGILGARMTGGGFGGAIVALAKRGSAAAAARRICSAYDQGGAPRSRVLVPAVEE